MLRRVVLALGALGLALSGCAKTEDVIVHNRPRQGKRRAVEIDSDPLALLPGGGDNGRGFGRQCAVRVAVRRQAAGRRQAARAGAGSGRLRPEARHQQGVFRGVLDARRRRGWRPRSAPSIRRRSKLRPTAFKGTPLGVPVTKSTYAGRALYTGRQHRLHGLDDAHGAVR